MKKTMDSPAGGKMKAVIECTEDIPCDPCVKSCPAGAISKKSLSAAPRLDENKCTGCANCVPRCPGRAIFVVGDGKVVVPYEFLPAPKKDASAELLDREGKSVGTGKILAAKEFDKTFAVTVSVPSDRERFASAQPVRRRARAPHCFEKGVRNIRIK